NSVLKIDGNATTGAITLDTANKTLEIGISGKSLTLTLQETMTAGKIQLDGGALSDSQGFQIDGGTLIGHGTVSGGTIDGAGTIEAAGGMLDLSGTSVGANATGLTVANDGSTLVVDTVASGAHLTFLGSSGTLKVLRVADFLGTIGGLVAANDTNPLNGIDLADSGTITRTQISGNTITVFNGNTVITTLTLASAPGAGISFCRPSTRCTSTAFLCRPSIWSTGVRSCSWTASAGSNISTSSWMAMTFSTPMARRPRRLSTATIARCSKTAMSSRRFIPITRHALGNSARPGSNSVRTS